MATAYESTNIKSIRALHDHILVSDMNFDERINASGIVILSTDKKLEGIHPRWARVYAVGPKQKDVKVGQYVCVAHGRWTRGLTITDLEGTRTIRRIDNADILLVSNKLMEDETIGDNMGVVQRSK